MSKAKDHTRTYLFRHRPDLVERVLSILPGGHEEFYFASTKDAGRFRGRLYNYVGAYFGYQKFVIAVKGKDVKVINLAGEIYDRAKQEGYKKKGLGV